jgi:cytochrome c-type biogenesis protein CcmH/NrfF
MVKRIGIAAAIALFLLAALARAEEPAKPAGEAPSWSYELAADLMSPFCPGRTLADCPSPAAASLRMWIVVQAAAGRSREDVEQELYDRYGDVIRSRPRAEGFGLAAYLVPLGVFAAGGLLVALVLRHMTRRAAPPAAPAAPPSDPELERLVDEELSH